MFSTKKLIEKAVLFRCHLRYMGMKTKNQSHIFFDSMSVVSNENTPGRSLNKKLWC